MSLLIHYLYHHLKIVQTFYLLSYPAWNFPNTVFDLMILHTADMNKGATERTTVNGIGLPSSCVGFTVNQRVEL